jgi:Ca-activated chloride channel homolog
MSLSVSVRVVSFTVLSLAIPVSSHGQDPVIPVTFRTSSQLVLVPVTVTDHYGKTITGLQAQDFKIFDGESAQPIVSFAGEDAPCSVGVVLDISGSMRNLLGPAKDAAHVLLKTANPEDEFSLLTVSTQPEAISGFTKDIGGLEGEIDSAQPGGATALIDTVYLGLSQMRRAKRSRRALIIISDGIENHSRYSKSELMRVALEADVQVYAIIFDNPSATVSGNTIPYRPAMVRKPGDQGAERQGPQLLEDLADKTGGLHFRVRNDAEAREGVVKAAAALRDQYVIGYRPSDLGNDGKWHRIRVKSTVPKVNVYARSGYYAH